MKYLEDGEIFTLVCAVNNNQMGGEFTICGNAIPDTRIDTFGCEPVGKSYDGKLKDINCPNCISFIRFVKGFK